MKAEIKADEKPYLLLKWGGIKGGYFKDNPEASKISDEINDAEMDNNQKKVKELTCKLIDVFNGDIHSWWEHRKFVSKQEAKDYILNYPQES